jgi:hypothetical protein
MSEVKNSSVVLTGLPQKIPDKVQKIPGVPQFLIFFSTPSSPINCAAGEMFPR